ncbi:hypothetical protein L1987_22976 [Smallanthus sonchifolius]|uniref:Uncharacterized protein n=1 Tax=Smallanthus sonchifolius TaxID=185202 RepID=A0ACB9IHU0_9ASTR|nr:hypothetical protein L1987_22976 [Smallanthus sonchifolius]
MSSRDSNQSSICSSQTLESAITSSFGADDDLESRFSLHREGELKVMLNHFPHHMRSEFDKWIRILVKEEIELSHKNQAVTITRRSKNFVSRNLELRISKIICPLCTGDHIKGIGGMPVTVTLIDSHTKEEVKSGPEASGKVEIVVIEAEVEDGRIEFESKLVCHLEGKKSVHVNSLPLKLLKGTAVFPTVSFARTKRWMKVSKIRLQARFVDNFDGVHVKESQTEPFLLKDRRTEAYNKHPIPSLHDDVWRLYNIDRKGTLAESLINADINNVEDFIVRLFLHPQCIKEIFDGAKHAKSLKATVEHARKCPAILKYHSSFDQKTEVVFNVSGEVLGLYQGDSFLSGDTLSETQKEVTKKLVISAFKNWEDATPMNEDQFVAHCTHLLNQNMLHDGHDPDPQFLPEFSSAYFDEIYRGFEGLCTIRLEREKNGYYKRWRKLFCVVTFSRSFDDFHAHKKRRFS